MYYYPLCGAGLIVLFIVLMRPIVGWVVDRLTRRRKEEAAEAYIKRVLGEK